MTSDHSAPLARLFSAALADLRPDHIDYVPQVVTAILSEARRARASDVHLVPQEGRMLMQWRVDGVLHPVASFEGTLSGSIIARLKVLAGLLTYRTDVPQEGRISDTGALAAGAEVRVTTFPTLFGEKAAIRIFTSSGQYRFLGDLGLPADTLNQLAAMLQMTSGVIVLTGPSGSGKTTTAYACLRQILKDSGQHRCLMSLEDPIEVVVPGVTQSQIRPASGFDLASGLRAMMRQDPDVIFVGEIRDSETAEAAFQAALTGHLVLTTFHAGSSVEAVTRLLEMKIEPYLLRSTLRAVVCQRLFRKACAACRRQDGKTSVHNSGEEKMKETIDKTSHSLHPVPDCRDCGGLGYHGRFVVAEVLTPDCPQVADAILNASDTQTLQSVATQSGMATLRHQADAAVLQGLTSDLEVFRVLGRP